MTESEEHKSLDELEISSTGDFSANQDLNKFIANLEPHELHELVRNTLETGKAKELLENLSKKNLARLLSSDFPGESAELVQQLPAKLQARTIQRLPPNLGASLLDKYPDDRASRIFELLVDRDLDAGVRIIKNLQTDTWVDLIQAVAPTHRALILEELGPADFSVAEELMAFPRDTAGGLMKKEYIAIHSRLTTADVVRHIRRHARKYQPYFTRYFYVVGKGNVLEGIVSLEQILFGDSKENMGGLSKEISLTVTPEESAEHIVRLFRTHEFVAIPVVDENRTLLGIVTQDMALKYAESSSEDKLLKMAGVTGEEFRDMPFRSRSWNRLSWLSINIILNLLAASIIAANTDVIQAAVALAVFLPIISDMSGCAGNQAIAVSIRELSLERIRPTQLVFVLGKEISVGLLNGLALGALMGGIAYLWYDLPKLGIAVGLALWFNTIIAVSFGGLIPLILRRIEKDPALASGPILTTMTDLCGFLLLLTLARHLLS